MDSIIKTSSLGARKRWRKENVGGELVSLKRRGRGSVAKEKTSYSEKHEKSIKKLLSK